MFARAPVRYYKTSIKFDIPKFHSMLKTHFLGRSFIYRHTTSSTMEIGSRELAEGAPHGTLVFAEEQTAGRGRGGRSWASPAGQNLYFSICVRPSDFQQLAKLNFAAGVAISETCAAFGAKVGIKWPNDIWYQEKRKLSGMLIDSSSGDGGMQAVLGIGINVNQNPGANDAILGNEAVSLAEILGHTVEREALLAALLNNLEALMAKDLPAVLTQFAKHDILVGREVIVRPRGKGDTTDEYIATAVGFGTYGELRVTRKDGTEVTLSAEDVSIRPQAKS